LRENLVPQGVPTLRIKPEVEVMSTISKISLFIAVMAMVIVLSCSKKASDQETITTNETGTVFEQVGYWEKGGSRIYTVYVIELDWVGMNVYAGARPHKEGRTTTVLFFNDRNGTPDVTNYSGSMHDVISRVRAGSDTLYWIARYDCFPSGEAVFNRYPMRE